MICYGQVKGRKYPANQPLPKQRDSRAASAKDEISAIDPPSTKARAPIIVDGIAVFDTVGEAAAFVGVMPYEAARVLRGERKSVKGHSFVYAHSTSNRSAI